MKPASSSTKSAFSASTQPSGQEASASQATPLSFQLSADSSSRQGQQSSPPETSAVYAAGNGVDVTNSKDAAQGLVSATDTAIQHAALQGLGTEAPVLGQASGSAAFDDMEAADAKVYASAHCDYYWQ